MKTRWAVAWAIIFGIAVGLLAAGVILLAASPPRGAPITLLPMPTPAPVMVHVSGAVAQPAVYSLPAGSRVGDAIRAAGGLLPEADTQALNLAAFLQDGSKVLVPFIPTPIPTPQPGAPDSVRAVKLPTLPAPGAGGLLNINTATQAELETLPGIGPVTAQHIIEYRQANGPFPDIEAIQDVPGIGPKTFEEIKDLISVGP